MPQHRFASGLAHGLATSPLFADNVADDGMLTGPEIVAGDRPASESQSTKARSSDCG